MSDLIDRQAAIEALERTKEKDPKGDIAYFYNTITDNKIAVIEALPSVQPDNDMIHLQKEQAYLQGWEDGREALRKEMWQDGRDRLD